MVMEYTDGGYMNYLLKSGKEALNRSALLHFGGIAEMAGTGAAPQSLMDDIGMVIKESLPIWSGRSGEARKTGFELLLQMKLITAELPGNRWYRSRILSNPRISFSIGCIRNEMSPGILLPDPKTAKGLVVENRNQKLQTCQNHDKWGRYHSVMLAGVTRPRKWNARMFV